MIKQK